MKPMKAPSKSIAAEEIKLPVMASVKIDGLRAMHDGSGLLSKTMNRFPNPHVNELFNHSLLEGMDGELVVGKPYGDDVLRRCGAIRAHSGEPDVHWWVFDDFTSPQLPFRKRLLQARNRIKSLPVGVRKYVHFLPHLMFSSLDDLLAYESTALSLGYEGLMLRNPEGQHKAGTCTERENLMFKFKRFIDGEAVVLRVEEGQTIGNEATRDADGSSKRSSKKSGMVPSGVVGTLICWDLKEKKEIRVAPGRMTKKQKEIYWRRPELICQRIINWRSFPTGTVNAPRFPTFQAFKNKADI